MAQLKDLLVSGAARFLNGLNINGDLTIAGNLLPAENETYNLGDSSYRWRQTQTKYLSVGAGDISSGIYEAVISGDLHTTGYSLFDDYVQIGGTRPSNYKFYVNGISFFNGDTIHNGIDYFANGTTYYINNNAVGNLNWLKLNRVSDHGLQVGTIRGMAVDSQIGEYIHMYERVHIGSPNGWGSRNAPSYGLSTYGGAWFATDTGVVNIGNTSNTTYKFYVNGSSYFNGNTTHNGINYFANGTTYYINNSAQASLNNVSIGGVDFGYKLYVNGVSYLGGNMTIKGHLIPNVDSNYDIGLTSKHWRYGYFDGMFISTDNGFTASSVNQGKSGSYLGSGNIEIAASTPYIDFHNANSTSDFSVRLISDAADRLHIQQGTTPASLSYNSRTINPLTYHQGIFYVSNQIESAEYFLNNRASAGGGFYVYGNNVQYARLYINTIGTTSDVGITQFELGNNRATSAANNSRGKLYIYGQTASTKLLLDATDRPFMYLYCVDGNNYYTNTTGTTATDYWQIYPEGQHLCFKTHTTGSYDTDNRTGTAGEWKYIQMFENGGLALNSTSQSVTPFGGSETTFILRAEGNGYFNGDVWGTSSFIANANSSTTGRGFVACNQNVQYARMYIETVGTAGDGTNNGTVGVGLLMLGNSTAVSTSTTAGANNARGAIRLYGTNANYTDIYSQANGNRNFYLPNYAGSMYAIHAGSNSAVGNATTPIYIAENGRVTACTSYTSALDGRYVNITGDTMTGNLTVPIVIGSLQGNASTASKVNNKLTVGSKTFDGSTSVTIYASDLGLASAMLFLGTTSTSIADGVTTNPITISGASKTVTAGNVVLYGSKEFVWTGSSWEELGNEGSYKIVQAAVVDPSASGTSNTFIATISQDANGKITASKKTVAVTNDAPTLSWGATSTIGSIAGIDLQVKMPANPNIDTKVTQTITTSNAIYPLLLAPSGQTATTTTTSYFDSSVTLNPSTNTITANISGNATTATALTSNAGSLRQPVYFNEGKPAVAADDYVFYDEVSTVNAMAEKIVQLHDKDGNKFYPITTFDGEALRQDFVQKIGDTMTGNLTVPSVYTSDWFRSIGSTGWYNQTYGGGWHMTDSNYIRNYNSKTVRLDNLCLGSDNNSYRLYVDGTSYFNGMVYFNNGYQYITNRGNEGYVNVLTETFFKPCVPGGSPQIDGYTVEYTSSLGSNNYVNRFISTKTSEILFPYAFWKDTYATAGDASSGITNTEVYSAYFAFSLRSPTNNSTTSPYTNYYEVYRLPFPTYERTSNAYYWILTSKSTSLTAANRLPYITSSYNGGGLGTTNHYANTTQIGINMTSQPSTTYNLYVNGYAYGTRIYGAVWNDYAEYRQSKVSEPGRCIVENGDDTLSLSSDRLQLGAEIISDTYGFAIGETSNCKTPVATTGRVLAYPYESCEMFKKNIGRPVCSGPNGTVSIMSPEEEQKYPSAIIGTISAVPDYEEWGTGKVKVNGRIWLRIR